MPNAAGDWIQPDAASPEEIAVLAHVRPSGAITCERLDRSGKEHAPFVNIVKVRENGSLAFHADMSIEGHDASYRATLCRCGASHSKPFCDGSHSRANFIATGESIATDSEALAERTGKLTIIPVTDGPIKVEGNLEVCSGTGKTLNRIQKA